MTFRLSQLPAEHSSLLSSFLSPDSNLIHLVSEEGWILPTSRHLLLPNSPFISSIISPDSTYLSIPASATCISSLVKLLSTSCSPASSLASQASVQALASTLGLELSGLSLVPAVKLLDISQQEGNKVLLHQPASQEGVLFDPNFTKTVQEVEHLVNDVVGVGEEFEERELVTAEEVEWPCGFCQKRFSPVARLLVHHEEAHKEKAIVKKRVFQCQQCPRFFKGMKSFVKHKDMHSEESKCENCDKTFKNAIGLKVHLKTHTKSYSNENAFAISKNQELIIMNKKHSEESMEGETPMIVEGGANGFDTWYDEEWACGLCPKRFSGESFLKGHHQRKHAEESETSKKVFACRECPKSFAILKNMMSHRVAHSVETKCDQCNVDLTNGEALKEHMKVHTRDMKE